MKKFIGLIALLGILFLPQAARTEEAAGGKVILDLQPDEDTHEIGMGEQIGSVLEVGRYFDRNYPGEAINEDFSEDVQRFFPGLSGNALDDRVELIRDSVKFYRYFYSTYEKIKSTFLTPEEPPLVLPEKDYEKPYAGEYIESPDLVVVNDFTKVVSYSSDAKDYKAYEEKKRQEIIAEAAKDTPVKKIRDMLAKLEPGKFLFYGTLYEDPLTKGAGNGRWDEQNGVKVRLASAYAAVNDLSEMAAVVHINLPQDEIVELMGENKPFVNLESSNLSGWSVFLPIPRRIDLGGREYLGQSGNFAIPLLLKIKDKSQSLKVNAEIRLNICNEKGCRAETFNPELSVNSGFGYASTASNFINQSFATLPKMASEKLKIQSLWEGETPDGGKELRLRLKTSGMPADLDVLVENEEGIRFDVPKISVKDDFADIFLKAKDKDAVLQGKIFTLIVKLSDYEALKVTLSAETVPLFEIWETKLTVGLLLAAVMGGLLLNFMPCVFPVLALKLMSVLGFGGLRPNQVRKNFLYSILGIWTAFAVLTGILAGLKALGYALGWGMQFQNGWFLVLMLFVIVLFMAQIAGIYELKIPETLGRPAKPKNGGNDFVYWFSGAATVVLATPCTAPYLATAVGFALSGGYQDLAAVMAAVALGLSLPYLLTAVFPGIVLMLPKPGKWMKKVEQLMLFLLLLTAGWLLSIVYAQTSGGVMWRLVAYLCVFFILLAFRREVLNKIAAEREDADIKGKTERLMRRILGTAAAVLVLIAVWDVNRQFEDVDSIAAEPGRPAIDYEEIAGLVDAGRTVIVDIDAEWCLTCRFNDYTVFRTPVISELIKDYQVVVIKVNWTRYNPEILDFMARFGRKGVPFYVIFNKKVPGGMVLPEVLTEKDFRKVLESYVR